MLLLGVLSWLQVFFLPGFILVKSLNIYKKKLSALVLIIGCSLVLNYGLVFVLTLLHLYTRTALVALLIVELLWVVHAIPFRSLTTAKPLTLAHSTAIEVPMPTWPAIAAILYLLYYLSFKETAPKSIFSLWDAVVSWDRWAIDWYHNVLPDHTYDYPQLVPANVSLTYQWIGNASIQLFGKCIFYVFPFLMIGCLWDLAKKSLPHRANEGFYWSIFFLVLLLVKLFGEQMASGMVDVPVACMGLLPIYVVLSISPSETKKNLGRLIFLGSICSVGAASTKQAGMLAAFLYPILLYLLVLKKSPHYSKLAQIAWALGCYALLFACLAPWQIYKFMQFQHGLDFSNTRILLQGEGYFKLSHPTLITKAQFGLHLLAHTINKSFLFTAPFLILLSAIKHRTMRLLTLWLVVPMFLIWLCYFSYDIRNLAFVVPFLSIVLGFGVQTLFYALKQFNLITYFINRAYLTTTLLLVLIATYSMVSLNKKYSAPYLMKQQIQLSQKIIFPHLNETMYAYFNHHPLQGTILSNYLILCFLPGFSDHCIGDSNAFMSPAILATELQQHAIDYLLLMKLHVANKQNDTTDMEHYLQDTQKTHYEILLNEPSFALYKIKRTVP